MASGAAVAKAPRAAGSLARGQWTAGRFPVVVGQPYQIGNVTFVPSDSMNFDSVGYASVGTEGGSTISAAHHTLPVPSYAEVTDINTGRTILVRVERRGPMDSAHAIELSPGAAAQLGVSAGATRRCACGASTRPRRSGRCCVPAIPRLNGWPRPNRSSMCCRGN
jgi:rare lipoprotein A